ncbi:MAG: T9SS type A sorting domain-containing protein, partial [Bacteroidota bacterium]|nr:T9SS type A sorting domain-containing protein [Bacteroidota bacterium]
VPGAFGVNYQQYSYNEKWMEHFVKYMAEKKLPGSFYYKLNANDGRGLLLSDWLTMKQDILIDLQLMFGMVEDTIHAAGGTIYSPRDGTSYNFGSGDLPANTIVTHTSMWSGKVNIPDLGDRGTILHEFEISSTAAANSYFSISVEYTDNELGSVDENSLSFFMFNGSGWDSIPGILDTANNQIQISTNLFGIFAVLGNNIPVSNISEIYGCTDPLSLNYNPEANINDGTCVYSPDWDYDLTAQLHTIEIPGTASFVLEDQNIEEYDFIGVFYDSLGVEKCGGYIMWEGTSITLNAYGDISGNTGFETGEKFCWKLWDASKASSFNLLANYDNSYPNTSDFANNGQSALTMIVTAIPDTQTISLNQGWNIISTNLHPCDASVENIYSSVINEICIVKDYEGNVFWPMVSINTIGNNITGRGYLVKTTSSNNFEVTGYSLMPEYNPIDLPAGWSMIAYLRNNPADLVAILSPYVSDINIVKDENGDVYWPSLGLNSVGDFDPGQGYQIYTNIPFSLTYPSNNESFAKSATSNLKPRFYNNVVHTDNNMTLGILLNNMDISIGDELAAFSNSGLLVGSTVVESENVAITLWGDDKLTDVIDGLLPGEDFIIKLKRNTNNYDNSSDEYELQIGTWYKGDGTYAINKTAIAGMASLISSDNELVLGQNYPNPFIGNTAIDFYLPEDCDVEFEIYNMLGEKLTTLYSGEISSGNHKINFNGDKLSAGTYYYQLKTANFEETKKMVIH